MTAQPRRLSDPLPRRLHKDQLDYRLEALARRIRLGGSYRAQVEILIRDLSAAGDGRCKLLRDLQSVRGPIDVDALAQLASADVPF